VCGCNGRHGKWEDRFWRKGKRARGRGRQVVDDVEVTLPSSFSTGQHSLAVTQCRLSVGRQHKDAARSHSLLSCQASSQPPSIGKGRGRWRGSIVLSRRQERWITSVVANHSENVPFAAGLARDPWGTHEKYFS